MSSVLWPRTFATQWGLSSQASLTNHFTAGANQSVRASHTDGSLTAHWRMPIWKASNVPAGTETGPYPVTA